MKHGNIFSVISRVLSITFISVNFIACTKATPKITSLGKDAKLLDFGSSSLSQQSTQSVTGLESEIEIKGQCSADVASLWIKDPISGKYLLASEFTKFFSFSDTDCSDGEFKIKLSTKDGAFKYDRQQTSRFTIYLRALSRFNELSERAISYEYKKDPNDPEIYFSATNNSVNEGSTLEISLQLSKPVAAEKSVQVSLGLQGADTTASYVSNNFDFKIYDNSNTNAEINLSANNLITFNPGETFKTIRISAQTDTNYEVTETVKLIFSNIVGASIVAGKETSTFNIIDKSLAPTFSVTQNISVTEGTAASFRISLSKITYKDIIFNVSTSEVQLAPAGNTKAIQAIDFDALTLSSVTIPSGSSQINFDVQTKNDPNWNLLPKVFSVTVSSLDSMVKSMSNISDATSTISITESDISNKPKISFKFQKPDGNGGFADISELTEAQAANPGYYLFLMVDKKSDADLNFKIKSNNSDNAVGLISSGNTTTRLGPFSKTDNSTSTGDSLIKWNFEYACLGTYVSSSCYVSNGTLDKTFTSTLTIKDDDLGGFNVSGVYSTTNTNPGDYLTDTTRPKIKWSVASGATNYDLEILDNGSNSIFKKSNVQLTDVDLYNLTDDNGNLIADLSFGINYTIKVSAYNADRSISQAAPLKTFSLNRSPKLNIGTTHLHIINSTSNSNTNGIILFTDDDGDTVSSRITSQSDPNQISTTINSGVLSFSPKNNFLGTSTVNIELKDGTKGGLTNLTLTVTSHNPYQFLGRSDNNISNASNYCGTIDLANGCLFDLSASAIDGSTNLIVDANCIDNTKCVNLTLSADSDNNFKINSLMVTNASELQIPVGTNLILNNKLTLNNSAAKISGAGGTLSVSALDFIDGDLTMDNLEFFGASNEATTINKSLSVQSLKINKHLKINEGVPEQTIFVTSLLNLYSGSVSANSKINFDVSGDISLNKNQKQNGDTNAATDLSSGTVTLTGGNNQTIQGSIGSYKGKFYNLIINKTGGTVTIKDNLSFHADYLVNNGAVAYDSTSAFWFDTTVGVNHKIKAPNHDIYNFQMSDPTNIEFQSNFSASNQCKYGNTTLFNGQTYTDATTATIYTLSCPTNTNPFIKNGDTFTYDLSSPLGTNTTTQIIQPVNNNTSN